MNQSVRMWMTPKAMIAMTVNILYFCVSQLCTTVARKGRITSFEIDTDCLRAVGHLTPQTFNRNTLKDVHEALWNGEQENKKR